MFGLDFKAAKEGFFDRAKVLAAADRATLRVLSRFGAYVRQRARSSIRKRRRVSQPGQPPSSHVGLLKDLIFFSYEPSARSVVVGPTLTNRPTGAPETLEYGGESDLPIRGGKTARVRIEARPYMHPALAKELPGLPAMWRDSIR